MPSRLSFHLTVKFEPAVFCYRLYACINWHSLQYFYPLSAKLICSVLVFLKVAQCSRDKSTLPVLPEIYSALCGPHNTLCTYYIAEQTWLQSEQLLDFTPIFFWITLQMQQCTQHCSCPRTTARHFFIRFSQAFFYVIAFKIPKLVIVSSVRHSELILLM